MTSGYTKDSIERVPERVRELIKMVNSFEEDFPGRHFTLDGHLVGSIGEVMASYIYGITLAPPSEKTHDGEVNGKKVQIKITQQNNIVIHQEPDYLIALYLRKDGTIYEIYNGPGKIAWDSASSRDAYNNRHMTVTKLMQLNEQIDAKDRIPAKHPIEKMKKEYRNAKK